MNTQKFNKLSLLILGWLMLFTLQASAQTNSVATIDVNKKPLVEFTNLLIKKWENKEIDLTKEFSVELQTTLNKDGFFDNSTTNFTKTEGDENIVRIVKSAIVAVNASRSFIYLKELDVDSIIVAVGQNSKTFSVRFTSKMKSAVEAKNVASGLKGSIILTKLLKQREIDGGEKDELKRQSEIDQLYLLKNTTVNTEEASLILKISLPKTKAQELIERSLKNEREKQEK